MSLALASILIFVALAGVAWFVISGPPKKWQEDEHKEHSV